MIKLDLRVPNLARAFKQHHREMLNVLAASMQTNRAMMFDKDGADNGKDQWAPINPMFRAGRPLQKTGTLRKSFAPQNDGLRPGRGKDTVLKMNGVTVTVGTSLAYAATMNDGTTKMPGGVIKPTRAQALKIPLADGGFMFRRSVKIPARPMNTITELDKQEWAATLSNFIADVLNSEATVG